MKLILENFRKFVNEGEDKVSKKISYLMDKEDKPQDQAVAIALSMKDRGELEEGFKSGEQVTHDEYGDGVVTHPGTKNTDVAVKFKKDTGRGKSIKVSRGSLKKAVKEVAAAVTEAAGVDWKEMFPRPYPSREAMEEFEKSGGRDADETVLAWLRSLPSDQKNFLRKLSVSEAAAATVALYQIDRRFDLRDNDPTFHSSYDTSNMRTPYKAWRFLKSLGADDSFLNEEVNEIFGLFGKKSSVRSPDEDSGIPNPRRAGTNYTYGDIALTWSEITCSKDAPKCEELGLYDIDLEPLMQVWANEGSPMPSEEELMYGGQVPVKVKDLKENKKMKITKARLRQMIKEEMDAMRGADRPGAGIEDIAQPEGEEPIDVLMDVKARLAGMSEEELMQLAADLDGDMVTALRHILSDRMY